jgi:hypothetical protein
VLAALNHDVGAVVGDRRVFQLDRRGAQYVPDNDLQVITSRRQLGSDAQRQVLQ